MKKDRTITRCGPSFVWTWTLWIGDPYTVRRQDPTVFAEEPSSCTAAGQSVTDDPRVGMS